MNLLEAILEQMSSLSKAQRQFVVVVLTGLMCLRGKANFRNLSRYRNYHEKTYSRGFRRDFDFVKLNQLGLNQIRLSGHTLVAAMDCSFISKSGKQTYGLDKFYNSKQGQAEKGLEISTLAVVDVTYNTAYNLSTRQTPRLTNPDETRVDQYRSHLRQDRAALPKGVRYLVADGYYSKTKFINGVTALELGLIGKLRHDANLRWLYQGKQKPRGRHKRYDGKVSFDDLTRLELTNEIAGVKLYTAVVNSAHFQRDLRIVYLVKRVGNGNLVQTALLFATALELAAQDIYRFYKARFQIEFLFRDAKQFTGLGDCQARCSQALPFHFNAAMTALNFIKWEDRQTVPDSKRHVISIATWKIRKANAHLLERFSTWLGLNFSSIKSRPDFDSLCNYGAITV